MTSLLPSATAARRNGHTEPRLFTPPKRELTPETSWGFECVDFLEKVLKWDLMPWQKWLYIHALEKDDLGIGFRFQTICILIARQNGKTMWLKGLGLWRLYLDNAAKVIISAQNLEFAENSLAEAVEDVLRTPVLRKEYVRFSRTNGKFRMELTGGREWRAAVSSRKGGRSLSCDLVMMDELREHQNWQAWNALAATTTARPRSLVVAASNAGDATSVVLRSLRDGALEKITLGDTAESQTALFEWSAPDDADHLDPEYWPCANPALGRLFTEVTLKGKAEAMHQDIPGFRTEHMCQWVATIDPSIFPREDWQATTDPLSKRDHSAPVWAALDINFERSRSYAAIASRRSDGALHVEVVEAQRGTDWVVPWFAERLERFQSVVVQARGAPASALIEDLTDAGVPITELGGADLTRAYGYFYDLVTTHAVFHRPSPALDAAVEAAKPRILGDAWAINRKDSPVDVSPLVAVIHAAAGEFLAAEVEPWILAV